MRLTNKYFEDWMLQSGKVKKLQLLLALAVIIILFLLSQIMSSMTNTKDISSFNRAPASKQQVKASPEAKSRPKVTEGEAKAFVKGYLESFFSTEESAYSFVKLGTAEALFISSIESELLSRKEQSIKSEFKMSSIYVEPYKDTKVKAYVFGQEHFPNGDYENRKFTIEMILDILNGEQKIKVSAIPVFRVD